MLEFLQKLRTADRVAFEAVMPLLLDLVETIRAKGYDRDMPQYGEIDTAVQEWLNEATIKDEARWENI